MADLALTLLRPVRARPDNLTASAGCWPGSKRMEPCADFSAARDSSLRPVNYAEVQEGNAGGKPPLSRVRSVSVTASQELRHVTLARPSPRNPQGEMYNLAPSGTALALAIGYAHGRFWGASWISPFCQSTVRETGRAC
jgi:hypothetical protein